jgi:hypothetical protein
MNKKKVVIIVLVLMIAVVAAYFMMKKKAPDAIVKSKKWFDETGQDVSKFFAGADANGNLTVTPGYSGDPYLGVMVDENTIQWENQRDHRTHLWRAA